MEDFENFEDFIDADIEQAMDEYWKGDRFMLFEAIRRCAQYGRKIPQEIRYELEQGMIRYSSAEVETVEDAFGIKKRSSSLKTLRKRLELSPKIYFRVNTLMDEGLPIDQALHQVAKEFNMAMSTCRDKYYYPYRREYGLSKNPQNK